MKGRFIRSAINSLLMDGVFNNSSR